MSAATAYTPPGQLSLAARLRTAQVDVRDDLEVSRHVFRGAPAYVVRDPVTFNSHRLDPADYEVLVGIRAHHTLGEIFDALCAAGKAHAEDEEIFYQFIMELHRLGFLRLPIADDKVLYRRFQARGRARRRALIGSILFLRVPLWNPDAFLNRTMQWARPLFSPAAFAAWLMLMVAAGYVLWARYSDLKAPLQGLLAGQNLPLMWLTLVVLKTCHEFGHAYACKHFGGHVPEMGAYFILFTPCAYVDATACWGFPRTRNRVIVCLAGMYVESILAAIAVFVWATTGPSLVNSVAYDAIFLAGVITILFNVNPLMRYDGYYVLSDILGLPNLRARSNAFLMAVLKRVFLRLPIGDREPGLRLRATLLIFGSAAALYRVTLLFTIAAIFVSKMFLVGMVLAVVYLSKSVFGTAARLVNYLWHAEETAPVRLHAVVMGVLLLVVLPAVTVLLPLPTRVYALGLIAAERETPVHTRQAGFVSKVHGETGDVVASGMTLVELTNDSLEESIAQAQVQIDATRTRRDAFLIKEPARALQEEQQQATLQAALVERKQRLVELQIAAPSSGLIVRGLRDRDIGTFLPEGSAVGLIVSGTWRVKALLDDDDYVRARPSVGDRVEFRAASAAGQTLTGFVVAVAPAGSRSEILSPLTQLAGGEIVVDPQTQQARRPYFEVTIALPEAEGLHYGVTGCVRMSGVSETIASRLTRRITRFINTLARE
jgi:putative peptide zinc metalloprotease protein